MHLTIIDYCLKVKAKFPDSFTNVNYIDFGSLDINGNNRYLFSKDCGWMGIDIIHGENVTIVSKCHDITVSSIKSMIAAFSLLPNPDEDYQPDTIISTQMLEHDKHWRLSLLKMYELLKPNGLLLLTWAAPGFGRHSSYEGQYPDLEHYYELSEADFRSVLDCDKLFSDYEFELNKVQKDLCFWGIKK